MKKLSILLLALSIIIPIHIHDEECGYDPETNQGCIYEESRIEPQDGWFPEG